MARLVGIHVRAQLLQLARYPAFTVPTLVFPLALFALFGLPQHRTPPAVLMASFAAYAVLGVAFFQFGVGIANERDEPWESFLRTLPVAVSVRFAARVASAVVFAGAAAVPVVALALATRPIALSGSAWLRFAVGLGAGGLPFALLGVALGYWLPAKGALPAANLLYLGLAYAGGMWTGPSRLPHAVERIAPLLPTRQWGDVLWPAVSHGSWRAVHWLVLAAWLVLFAALAAWGYRRDEGQRFR